MNETKSAKPATIAVALGGGSARGYAHIGALSSLEQNSLYPNLISGTSFGAVIGVFYAMGHSIEQLTEDAKATKSHQVLTRVADFGFHKAALFTGDKLEQYYDKLLEGRHFTDLNKKLVVATTDVDTGELVLIDEGPLATAIRASCSMPGVFAPVEINGRRLVDGGLAAPIPLDTLKGFKTDLSVGISAGTTAEDSTAIKLTQKLISSSWGSKLHSRVNKSMNRHPVFRLARGLSYTANTYLVNQVQEGLQVHTNPPISWLQFHKASAAIVAGEAALNDFMPKILASLAPALAAD